MAEETENVEVQDKMVTVISDVKRAQKRYSKVRIDDVGLFVNNDLFPLLTDFMEAVDERFGMVEDVVANILEQSESMVTEDLAGQITALVLLGGKIAEELSKTQPSPENLAMIAEYKKQAEATLETLSEVTIDGNAEDDDEEEDDEEEGDK